MRAMGQDREEISVVAIADFGVSVGWIGAEDSTIVTMGVGTIKESWLWRSVTDTSCPIRGAPAASRGTGTGREVWESLISAMLAFRFMTSRDHLFCKSSTFVCACAMASKLDASMDTRADTTAFRAFGNRDDNDGD